MIDHQAIVVCWCVRYFCNYGTDYLQIWPVCPSKHYFISLMNQDTDK